MSKHSLTVIRVVITGVITNNQNTERSDRYERKLKQITQRFIKWLY